MNDAVQKTDAAPSLTIRGLDQYYGGSHILWGVDLDVTPGAISCLMGRNGMGKTTTVRTIMGLVPAVARQVRRDLEMGAHAGRDAAEELEARSPKEGEEGDAEEEAVSPVYLVADEQARGSLLPDVLRAGEVAQHGARVATGEILQQPLGGQPLRRTLDAGIDAASVEHAAVQIVRVFQEGAAQLNLDEPAGPVALHRAHPRQQTVEIVAPCRQPVRLGAGQRLDQRRAALLHHARVFALQ